jgi:hypothetical protein
MYRTLIAAALFYAYGHPAFDGYRPGVLDAPLQGLHREINHMASDGQRALGTLDDARSMRYLKGYTGQMTTILKGS